mmetsp:Transcript_114617/g.370544  ORF Transcript_114617/g.370544 Transcript_114617/m.370544 type:complete len:170 (+) Transcript_114617:336-845(+)
MSGFLRAPSSFEEEDEELAAALAASLLAALDEQPSRAATAAAVLLEPAAALSEPEPEVSLAAAAASSLVPDNVARCGDILDAGGTVLAGSLAVAGDWRLYLVWSVRGDPDHAGIHFALNLDAHNGLLKFGGSVGGLRWKRVYSSAEAVQLFEKQRKLHHPPGVCVWRWQ